MSIEWRKPCEHRRYDAHGYRTLGVNYDCPGGSSVTTKDLEEIIKGKLIREWRCWREDGTYYGPCKPPEDNWAHEAWREGRHFDCGWQFYIMEMDLPVALDDRLDTAPLLIREEQ